MLSGGFWRGSVVRMLIKHLVEEGNGLEEVSMVNGEDA
jgi:hypothetical protein